VHKACLEDLFRSKKNNCQVCSKTIADGFEKALHVPKMKPNKVTKKKKEFDYTKNKVMSEMIEKSKPLSFGIEGIGITG